jgi:hypothetical protein
LIAFNRAKESSSAKKPKLSQSALQYFEASVNSLANGKVEVDKSAADIKVDEIVGYIHGLEKQMATTIKHSEHLVKRSREISQAMFELGQTLSALGQSENDAIGTGLSQVSSVLLFTAAHYHCFLQFIYFLLLLRILNCCYVRWDQLSIHFQQWRHLMRKQKQ